MNLLISGSFDPITIGHVDLINRARRLCDNLHINIGNNASKQSMFSFEDRKRWIDATLPFAPELKLETIVLFAKPAYRCISSSTVKTLLKSDTSDNILSYVKREMNATTLTKKYLTYYLFSIIIILIICI